MCSQIAPPVEIKLLIPTATKKKQQYVVSQSRTVECRAITTTKNNGKSKKKRMTT